MNNQKIKTLAWDVIFDIIGSLCIGFSTNFFTAPNHMAPGGVTGISILINYLTGFPIGTASFLMNVPLMILSFKYLGRNFSLYTLKTMTILSLSVDFVAVLMDSFGISGYTANPMMAAIMGGVVTGVGLAVIFLRGSTTGGLDIVMRLMKLKLPHLSIGRLFQFIDGSVLLASVLVFQNIESGFFGLLFIFANTKMMDTIIYSGDKGKTIMIVSDKYSEIAKAINTQVQRGVTLLHAEGAYSAQERKIVLCAVRDAQFPSVKRVVHDIDPQAFIMVNNASQILGTGFKPFELEE